MILHAITRFALALFFSGFCMGQCELQWSLGPRSSGPAGTVYALASLPNGDSVAAGSFVVAGHAIANNIARWNGSEWLALDYGLEDTVRALTVMPSGDLIAGGQFQNSFGGAYTIGVARWDGTSWHSTGFPGVRCTVWSMLVASNGDLVVCGSRQMNYNLPIAPFVARWDGTTWTDVGIFPAAGSPLAITEPSAGEFVAVSSSAVVAWDGAQWSIELQIAAGFFGMTSVATMPNGDIAVGGNIAIVGSARVVIWDGLTFTPSDPGLGAVRALSIDSNGDLLAGGGIATNTVSRFDGTSWSQVGTLSPERVHSLAVSSTGEVLAGGLPSSSGLTTNVVVRLQGNQWVHLGGLRPPDLTQCERLPNGDIVVAGSFQQIGGILAGNVALWNGTAWSSLGLGVDGPVSSLAVAPGGTLLVGGEFQNAGGAPASRIARWDGSVWSALGTGLSLSQRPVGIAESSVGEVMVITASSIGGDRFAVFSGGLWTMMSAGYSFETPRQLLSMPGGEILIAGNFVTGFAQRGLLQYQGGSITAVPVNWDGSVDLVTLTCDNELLVAVIQSGGVHSISRRVGYGLQVLASAGTSANERKALVALPNGDFVLAGSFDSVSQQPAKRIARWQDGSWQEVDGGVQLGEVTDACLTIDGELFCVGTFAIAGGRASASLARAATSCPASVAAFGMGCTGNGGAVTLTTSDLPWIGTTFEATAAGLPTNSLGVYVVGLPSASVLLPVSPPGCFLHLAPILTDVFVPIGMSTIVDFAIPNDAQLIAFPVRTQVVGIELTANLSLQQLTSSNALHLTIGSL